MRAGDDGCSRDAVTEADRHPNRDGAGTVTAPAVPRAHLPVSANLLGWARLFTDVISLDTRHVFEGRWPSVRGGGRWLLT
jgi:hypothetical protein